jgi:glutathione peroxidase
LRYLSTKMKKNIYSFSVPNLQGKEISLSNYQNKVVLIVNTASECGLTPQFKDLEELYKTYKDKGLVILGFPSNQFSNQEPLEGEAIEQFCELNYGVSFPIFDKTDVKGETASPLFKFLSNKNENGAVGLSPKWNFQKYLINRQGEVVDYFLPITTPTAGRVKRAIEKLL